MYYNIKRSGAYIRALRIRNHYTQEELAAAVKMDRSYLSRIESGGKGCSVDLLLRLSGWFHVPLEELVLGGPDAKQELLDGSAQLDREIETLISHLTRFQEQLREYPQNGA